MELDQLLFKRFLNFYKRVTAKTNPETEARTVVLEPIKPRLSILARALSGDAIDILTAQREGGFSGNNFFLPAKMSVFSTQEKNLNYYIFRIVYLSHQRKLKINLTDADDHRKSADLAFEKSEKVLSDMTKEFPFAKDLHDELLRDLQGIERRKGEEAPLFWLYGKLMKNTEVLDLEMDSNSKAQKKEQDEIETEIDAKPSDEVETIGIDKKQQEDYVLTHNFEKVDTAEEFDGVWRSFDGDDDLGEHEDALQELDLKFTVRANDSTHSIYKAEFSNSNISLQVSDENATAVLKYDEWNYKKRAYKRDFCTVNFGHLKHSPNNYYRSTIDKNQKALSALKKMFAQINSQMEMVKNLRDGEEIDIDAVTDAYTDMHHGHTPNDKLYRGKRKNKKDISILILVDNSLSSDGYTAGNRVLDIEKQAVILFGETLNEYDISFQIDTFSSKTRNNCVYTTVKSFKEPWRTAREKVGCIEAENYTRIGTALRHAGSLLEKAEETNRWIVLLSDGKPNDFDRYEGQYGIEDVKQALREVSKKHIRTFSLAIEEIAKYYLPQMFGHHNYNILHKPSDLPLAFAKFYKMIQK